jgi:hypothetical protein
MTIADLKGNNIFSAMLDVFFILLFMSFKYLTEYFLFCFILSVWEQYRIEMEFATELRAEYCLAVPAVVQFAAFRNAEEPDTPAQTIIMPVFLCGCETRSLRGVT